MRLTAPHGIATRPTTDRVKEALFSILGSGNQLEGMHVLDLFAGSGALGIEALSRGAAHVSFVEKSRPALESIRQNLTHTKFTDRANLLNMDVRQALERFTRNGTRFDLILIDPPYQSDIYLEIINRIEKNLLTKGGVLVAESSTRIPLPAHIGSLSRYDRRIYGDTALEFYSMEQHDAP
jgi:16S rRNA (guanine(966)-N(2))-methyltransferase RsmD